MDEPDAADEADAAALADGETEEEPVRELMPLEGRLVQIFGMGGAEARSLSAPGEGAGETVDVEGRCGFCASWLPPPDSEYVVETLDGALVAVPADNLQEWIPEAAEAGGFDLAWPSLVGADVDFGASVCSELVEKGYCLIQTFLGEKERLDALEAAEGSAEKERQFYRFQQEIEAGYMGFDNNTKVANLDAEEDEADAEEDGAPGALASCNRQLTDLGAVLTPFAPISLDFEAARQSATMIRMSIDRNEEDELFPERLADMMDDEQDQEWTGHISGFVRFIQCRRVSIISFIQNDGGDLWLYPKRGVDLKPVHLPLTPNKLLVFRHDIMDYSYQPRGRSLALQGWLMTRLKNAQEIKQLSVALASPETDGLVIVNPGPPVQEGPRANCMALTTRFPGDAWESWQYWLMFAGGTDGCTRVPYTRWDFEPYYEEGCDSNQTGKAYTCHGGFCSSDQVSQLDNVFFGISEEEAQTMVPGQKMSTEVGYECLVGSGYNRKTLRGRRIGSWYGDVGPDWGSFQEEWGRFCPGASHTMLATSMLNCATSARIAYLFDLKGPISSYDTACSASLVAMNAAHLLMFDTEVARADNAEALVVGVNTLLGPGSFIGNCMATMLSHQGRSFTFNRAADGYQRGEGCGALFLKMFMGDAEDDEKRVATLVGTATNQDGRSASLTAPNGPAQQSVIKKSMAFARINPNSVSIAECHGTGTALGDPIEVGALMAVMHSREFPILKTSAKSNIAHLEAGAGIAGLNKCIMMINMATAPPNCHLNIINPHLTVTGYPVYFDSEVIDTGFSSLCCGVSSFGFGGTNSRADVYGNATKGHKAAIRVELPRVSAPRVQPIGQAVFIRGSWSDWADYEVMDGGRYGTYTHHITLGENRWEEFQLSTSETTAEVIHPLVPAADQSAQIIGPDWDGKGLHFRIDGERDGAPAGQTYEITFTWQEERKTIAWRPVDAPPPAAVDDDAAGADDAEALADDPDA